MKRKGLVNWLDSKLIGMRTYLLQKNEGMGTVEIISTILYAIKNIDRKDWKHIYLLWFMGNA